MGRLDIKIKRGTRIVVQYSDGATATWEATADTDIDHVYDTLGRLEQLEQNHADRSE